MGALAALGERPFPTAGDLRFRPCPNQGDDQTRFEPLAVLRGPGGHEYGPGIALLDRRDSDPARMVYVWERMWDVVYRDALLRAVLDRAVAMRSSPTP